MTHIGLKPRMLQSFSVGQIADWPQDLVLPKTRNRYRVVRKTYGYIVEVKGWFFWSPLSGNALSSAEQCLKEINDNEHEPIPDVVAETGVGGIQSEQQVCRYCGK